MASRNVNLQETWSVEPELTESPPRRIMRSDFPDLNQPNAVLFYSIGGVALIAGIILLIVGLTSNPLNGLLLAIGIVLVVAGAGLAGFVPTMINRHIARTEQLAIHGIPVMARVLAADNLSGDSRNARLVKYQVVMPGGELIYRQVHADDRLLPVRIPGNATALINLDTGDVELYCALPFRAMGKTGPGGARVPAPAPDPLADLPVAPTAPVPTASTGMNTLNVENIPTLRTKTAEPAPATIDSGNQPKPAKADSGAPPKQGMASLGGVAPVAHEKPAATVAPVTPAEPAPVATTSVPPYEGAESDAGPPKLQPLAAVTDDDDETPKADTDAQKDPKAKDASGLPWE